MSRIDAHVGAVQRKLALAIFIEWAMKVLAILAGAAVVTIVLQRMIHFGLRPMALFIALGVGLVTALVLTLINRPSRTAAAVALDERLGLKEKFSTALTLRKTKSSDPFVDAVIRDAEHTAGKVNVGNAFPLEFPSAGLWAIGLAVAAVLSWMLPEFDIFGRKEEQAKAALAQQEAAQARQLIKDAVLKIESLPPAVANSEEVKISKRALEELLAKNTPQTREAAARRVAEQLEQAEKGLQKAAQASKEFATAKAMEKMFKSNNQPIEGTGPVADAQRKMVKGDYEEAMKDIERAVNDFEKKSAKEKEEMAQQMNQMAQQLNQLAQDPRAQEKLQQQMQQLGMNQQQMQQVQQQIQQAAGNPQAQQQLQQQMQQAMAGMNQQQQQAFQNAVQQAQQAQNAQQQAQAMQQAAQQLAQAMQQQAQQQQQQQQGQQPNAQQQQAQQQAQQQMQQAAQQMQQQLAGLQQMQQQAQMMGNAQAQMQQAQQQAAGQMNGNNQGGGQQGGNMPAAQGQQAGGGQNEGGQVQPQDGMRQGGGIGAGDRSGKSLAAHGFKSEVSKSHYDEKGKHLASIYVKDKSVKGEAKMQLKEAIAAGQADAGDDIDDTRIDRRAQEAVRRYFQVVEEAAK